MIHSRTRLARATTAVAICLPKYSYFPTLFLHLLWLYLLFFFLSTYVLYLCLFWSVSLIMWSELSGDTKANNTPGEEKRGVVVCENSLGVIPTSIYINNCTSAHD